MLDSHLTTMLADLECSGVEQGLWGKVELLVQKAREAALKEGQVVSLPFFRSLCEYVEILHSTPEITEVELEYRFLISQLAKAGLSCRDANLPIRLDKDDIIEAYNSKHIQVFRNLEFFLHSSYSLTSLISTTWPELFERDAAIMESMRKDLAHVSAASGREPVELLTPAHQLKERGAKQFFF